MAARAGITDDVDLRVLLEGIIRSQLDVIDSRLSEVRDLLPSGKEAKVLGDLRAMSKAALGLVKHLEQDGFDYDRAVAS